MAEPSFQSLHRIARIRSGFSTKFGIPRQSNLVEGLKASVIFEPEYRNHDAVRGLDAFSHVWLIWEFSETRRDTWSPTVRPPRLGGNTRVGVFATRSPFRPNPLGLSSVRLDYLERHPEFGPVIHVSGADLLDGTTVYDIKPYIPTDCHPDARGGFVDTCPRNTLVVSLAEGLEGRLPIHTEIVLCEVLAQDPRPSYHADPQRIYGMEFDGYEVKFTVSGDTLLVRDIIPKE